MSTRHFYSAQSEVKTVEKENYNQTQMFSKNNLKGPLASITYFPLYWFISKSLKKLFFAFFEVAELLQSLV